MSSIRKGRARRNDDEQREEAFRERSMCEALFRPIVPASERWRQEEKRAPKRKKPRSDH